MIQSLEELRPWVLSICKAPDERTRVEAKQQFDELMSVLPERLFYFVNVLKDEGVDVTGSPEAVLTRAADWLISRGSLVQVPSTLDAKFEEPDMVRVLSIPTLSACCYLGHLFGDYILKQVPGTQWQLATDSKRNINYHRAIIRPAKGKAELEPTRITRVVVLGRLDGTHPQNRLGDVFALWRDILLQQS
jgi:hypothetical protein